MTISGEIQRIKTNIANAYTVCDDKGATMPVTQNTANLANTINSIPSGSTPVITSLTVTPSTTEQTIVTPSGTDGYGPVHVNAVTSSIDSDIIAGNIKSGVNILGVTGTVTELAGETKTVSVTSTSGNTFTPSSGKNGITSIKCNPTNKALTITPTTTTQTFTVPSGYSGHGTVTCNASSGGVAPTGTLSINANGTYDVTNYASADVNVSGDSEIGFLTHPVIPMHIIIPNWSTSNIVVRIYLSTDELDMNGNEIIYLQGQLDSTNYSRYKVYNSMDMYYCVVNHSPQVNGDYYYIYPYDTHGYSDESQWEFLDSFEDSYDIDQRAGAVYLNFTSYSRS